MANRAKHLGHMLCKEVGLIDVHCISAALAKSTNILFSHFGSIPLAILSKLFMQYCSSYYGIVLCDMSSKQFEDFCITWRKAVKRVLRVPLRTHSRLLPYILKYKPLNVTIACRIVKFYVNALSSENTLVKQAAQRCLYQCTSNMGNNIKYIDRMCNFTHKLNVNKMYVQKIYQFVKSKLSYSDYSRLSECDINYIDVVKECIDLRDGLSQSILTAEQYCQLLECLCTI